MIMVFDLDDTLYPEMQFVHSGFNAVDQFLRRTEGLVGFHEHAQRLFEAQGSGTIFDDFLIEVIGMAPKSLVKEMVQIYRNHKPRLTLFSDARWALSHFGPRHQMGLLTDGYFETQRNKVAALGIAHVFDAIVYSDELGRANWKPSPVPYQTVMERLASQSELHCYVSDNPRKDFIAPRAMGWHTVRLRRPCGLYAELELDEGHEVDVEISSLLELPQALR